MSASTKSKSKTEQRKISLLRKLEGVEKKLRDLEADRVRINNQIWNMNIRKLRNLVKPVIFPEGATLWRPSEVTNSLKVK